MKPENQLKATRRHEQTTTPAKRRLQKLGIGIAASSLVLGTAMHMAHASNKEQPSYAGDIASISDIQIENGARLRQDPKINDDRAQGTSNLLSQIDFGRDLPRQYKIPVELDPSDTVYVHVTAEGDDWVGLPAETLAKTLPGSADALRKDNDGIVWVNHQKVSYQPAHK